MITTIAQLENLVKEARRIYRLQAQLLHPHENWPGYEIWFEVEGIMVQAHQDGSVSKKAKEELVQAVKPVEPTFKSGKYRGKTITEVPRDYVEWCADNANGEIGEMCRQWLKGKARINSKVWGDDEFDNIHLGM